MKGESNPAGLEPFKIDPVWSILGDRARETSTAPQHAKRAAIPRQCIEAR